MRMARSLALPPPPRQHPWPCRYLPQSQGYAAGVTLFGAGYDFRQSTHDSARALLARLQVVSRRCGGRRVNLVTHSMGGLVARTLLADFPAEFEALVRGAAVCVCVACWCAYRHTPPRVRRRTGTLPPHCPCPCPAIPCRWTAGWP